jgi:hypothetical protein
MENSILDTHDQPFTKGMCLQYFLTYVRVVFIKLFDFQPTFVHGESGQSLVVRYGLSTPGMVVF